MRRAFAVVVMLLFAALPMLAATGHQKADRKAQKASRLQADRLRTRGGHARAMRIHATGKTTRTAPARTSSVRRGMLDSTAPAPSHVGFLAATSVWQEAYESYYVATGDFNHDGKADVFFDFYDEINCCRWSWAVALGNGDGTFSPATVLSISNPGYEYMLFAADLNGDGNDDIVIGRYDSSVDVYLSNGDGTFADAAHYSLPGGGWWGNLGYLVKDLDGNGKPDIAAVSVNTYSTLLNNGDGTFGEPTSVTYGSSSPSYPVIADFNGDGKLDVAGEVYIGSGYGVAVWLATDTGFAEPVQYAQPGFYNSAYFIAAGDVNGDNKPDIVSVDGYERGMMAYIQQADGTFLPKGPFFAGDYPEAATLADVDGDGKAEVLVSNDDSGAVAIMKADANGNFTMTAAYDAGGWTWSPLAVGDFNGDGKLDFVAANDEMDISYFQNLGDGTFRAGRHYFPQPQTSLDYFYAWAYSVAVADFNGDGIPDVVTGEDGDDSVGVTVYLGKGDGTFKPAINLGSGGYMYYVAAGDLNGDGYADVVATDEYDYTVKVYYGSANGTFQSPVVYPANGNEDYPYGLVVVDLNGDGKLDVAVYNDYTVSVLLNDGTGALALSAAETSLSEYGDRIVAGDVNGDGKMDLVTRNEYGAEVLLGNGDGTFQDASYIELYTEDYYWELGIALGDVNKDGKLDIVASTQYYYGSSPVVRRSTTSPDAWDGVVVALGNGDGTFQDPVLNIVTLRDENTFDSAYPWGVAVADIDNDGNPDILAATEYYGSVALLYGRGDGTFYDPVEYITANYGSQIAAADLNGDGAIDVAVSSDDMGMSVLLNAGGVKWTVTPTQSAAGATSALAISLSPSVKGVTAVPSGNLTVTEGTTELGTGTLAAGSATITFASSLTGASAHILTVAYGGDTNFAASSLQALAVAGATDYDLSADKTAVTIKAGQSALINITVTPKNGFTGTISFSCGTLPTGVACSFSPASVTPNGVDPVNVTLIVSTTAAVSASAAPGPIHNNNSQLPLWASLWGMGAIGMVLAGGTSRKRKAMMLLALLALGLLVLLAGCGHVTDTVEKTVYVQQATPAGTSTVQVNATAFGSAKSLPLTITIN